MNKIEHPKVWRGNLPATVRPLCARKAGQSVDATIFSRSPFLLWLEPGVCFCHINQMTRKYHSFSRLKSANLDCFSSF